VFDAQLLAFAGVALVLSVTPGPDMALVLRNSFRGGRPAAYRTILGIGVGLLGWAAATALGVAAVLAASATLFTALKIAGGIYLAYLGVQTLLALRRGEEPMRAKTGRRGSPFRQGLVTNLLNPKLAVFFTTLLPQFISEGDPVFAKSILLAGLFVAIGMTWLVVYVQLVDFVARSERFRRAVEAVSGAVLVALGARLVVDRG
jgi:threonine/homoserine/homoserine lactone efflux protein